MRKLLIPILVFTFTSVSYSGMVIQNNMRTYIKPVPSGPVAGYRIWYKFDENNDTTCTDYGSLGYNGTYNGSTTTAQGYINRASSYNTTSDFVDTGHNDTLNTSGDFSVEFWVKMTTATDMGIYIFAEGYGSTPNRILVTIINFGGAGTRNVGRIGVDLAGTDSGFKDTLNTTFKDWTHVVLVRESDAVTAYINTVPLSIATLPGTVGGAGQNARYGTLTSGSSMQGMLDECRIYHKALSQAEVNQNYALH